MNLSEFFRVWGYCSPKLQYPPLIPIFGYVLNVFTRSQEMNINVLTISSKSTPADPVSYFVDDLRLAPLQSQVEVAVVGIDAVLYFSPKKDRDGLIIDIDGFTIISHVDIRNGREPRGSLPLQILLFDDTPFDRGINRRIDGSIARGHTKAELDVFDQGVQVADPDAGDVGPAEDRAEPVAARGQVLIHRYRVGGHIVSDGSAIRQRQVVDARPDRERQVVRVGDTRNQQHLRGSLGGRELLLQQGVDLAAGQRHRNQLVVERLDG